MPTNPSNPSPFVIVAAVDFDDASQLALQQAWLLATQRPDAELHVVHVANETKVPHTKATKVELRAELLQEVPPKVRAFAIGQAQAANLPPLNQPLGVHVRFGKTASAIMQLAADLDANLLVVGSHGKRGIRHALGSVSRKLVETGRLPVLVTRPRHLEDMAQEEGLEPPCPDCLTVRRETGGQTWWCELHGRPHVDPTYHSSTGRVRFSRPPADFEGMGR
jgi:nucleotide-binding universal stress UspA family protein